MKFVIVTGMSGAGKTTAMKILEDVGYFCVDNLPIALIPKFSELFLRSAGNAIEKVALGVDIRSGDVAEFVEIIDQIPTKEIIFMDAADDRLIKRFKETRRSHPLAVHGRVDEGIALERKQLEPLKKRADYIIDTGNLLTRELRKALEEIYVENKAYKNIFVTILSFGFKYGIPSDSDLVFDVRFMPNPYYDPKLRRMTGNDEEIQRYVMDSPTSVEFVDKLEDMVKFLIPNYIEEGKNQLVISIGCTGGKHRSVTVANALYNRLLKVADYGLKIMHRDISNW